MNNKITRRYQALSGQLKELFKEFAALAAEHERLSRENIALREEVALLRLYLDTYLQAGGDVADLEAMDLLSSAGAASDPPVEEQSISPRARELYDSLPQSFDFSELFELAELLGVEREQMKSFMNTYLRENLMQQHGMRVEKTGKGTSFWGRSLDPIDQDDPGNAKT